MKKYLLFTVASSMLSFTILSTAYGTAIVESGGFIMNAPGESESLWEISNLSYTLNSGDAIYDTDDYIFDSNNNRLYSSIETDTQRTWDPNPLNISVSNQGVATALTTSSDEIIENVASVYNNGEGVSINASTASTLNRTFTLDQTWENYQITVDYSLFGSISLDDPADEWGNLYHYAYLGLSQQVNGAGTELAHDLFTSSLIGDLTGSLSITYDLQPGIEYTIQTHLYNSATAYSPDIGSTAPVPEPATMILFGTGLAGLLGSRLRRKK